MSFSGGGPGASWKIRLGSALAALTMPAASLLGSGCAVAPSRTPEPPVDSNVRSLDRFDPPSANGSGTTPAPIAPATAKPKAPKVWTLDPQTPGLNRAMGRLGFGGLNGKAWTPELLVAEAERNPALKRLLQSNLKKAETTLDMPIKAFRTYYAEGLYESDPRRIRTYETRARFDDLYAWALAARIGSPGLQAKAEKVAIDTLLDWARTYRPSGNPINENAFTPVFQAADMMLPLMTPAQRGEVRAWLARFIHKSETFPLLGKTSINNWKTWNLEVRGVVATVLGDSKALSKVQRELSSLLKKTIYKDGSSYDFHHRDALHYHVYNGQALMALTALAPEAVRPDARRAIARSIDFLEPYYTGEKSHIEFRHTQVRFDIQRAERGEETYQPHRWDPRKADNLLFQARALFPKTRDWTEPADKARGVANYRRLPAMLATLSTGAR